VGYQGVFDLCLAAFPSLLSTPPNATPFSCLLTSRLHCNFIAAQRQPSTVLSLTDEARRNHNVSVTQNYPHKQRLFL